MPVKSNHFPDFGTTNHMLNFAFQVPTLDYFVLFFNKGFAKKIWNAPILIAKNRFHYC